MKTLISILFLFCPLLIFSQIQLINLTSTNPNEKELFFGAENHIKVKQSKFGALKARLSFSHGEYEQVNDSTFFIIVTSEKPDTIKVFIAGSLVHTEVFKITKIPHEVARLGDYEDTIISIPEIVLNPYLSVIIPKCSYKHDYRVSSFRISLIDSNMDTVETFFQPYGNSLLIEQIQAIKNLKRHDKIHFTSVNITCPSGLIRRLPPLILQIK